jgi:hypothetical protein
MTENESQAVGLQLAPSAHVTEAMRAIVKRAFTDAGVTVRGWVPLEREARPEDWGPTRIADPTLSVLVAVVPDRSPDEVLSALAGRLGAALATIRGALPKLPLSINVSTKEGTQWLAFRVEDSPAAIARGTAALSETFGRGVDALGWDDAERRWRRL